MAGTAFNCIDILKPSPMPERVGEVVYVERKFELSDFLTAAQIAAIATNDTIKVFKLPANCVPVEIKAYWDDLNTGTGTFSFGVLSLTTNGLTTAFATSQGLGTAADAQLWLPSADTMAANTYLKQYYSVDRYLVLLATSVTATQMQDGTIMLKIKYRAKTEDDTLVA